MCVLISHSHRFIFVHISEDRRTSMKRALAPYCHQPPRTGLRRLLSHLPVQESPVRWRSVCTPPRAGRA